MLTIEWLRLIALGSSHRNKTQLHTSIMWVTDFAQGVLRLGVSEDATCTFSKASRSCAPNTPQYVIDKISMFESASNKGTRLKCKSLRHALGSSHHNGGHNEHARVVNHCPAPSNIVHLHWHMWSFALDDKVQYDHVREALFTGPLYNQNQLDNDPLNNGRRHSVKKKLVWKKTLCIRGWHILNFACELMKHSQWMNRQYQKCYRPMKALIVIFPSPKHCIYRRGPFMISSFDYNQLKTSLLNDSNVNTRVRDLSRSALLITTNWKHHYWRIVKRLKCKYMGEGFVRFNPFDFGPLKISELRNWGFAIV